MNWFHNCSLRRKQVLVIMLASGVALLLACVAFAIHDAFTFRRELAQRLESLAEVVGNNLTAAIDFNDPAAATETLTALRGERHVVMAHVRTNDGRKFAEYLRARAERPPDFSANASSRAEFTGGFLRIRHAITSAGEQLGTIELLADLDELAERLWRYARIASAVLGASLLVSFILSAWLQRLIADPILQLAGVARSVAKKKDYSLRAEKTTRDELGQLIDGFNEMLSQIQLRDDALRTARDTLESRVRDRTAELAASVSLLRATIDSTADGILALDREGRTVCFNRQFVTMWGVPAEMGQRRDAAAMVAHCTAQAIDHEADLRRVRAVQERPEIEALDVITLKDGRVFERYSRPQLVDDRCIGHVLNFRDVTERRRAEAEIAYERDLLRALLEACPDSIYFKDRESRFLRCSASMARALKCASTESLLGKTDFDLFDPALAQATREDELGIMRTGEPIINKTERAVWDGGQIGWTMTSKVPLRDVRGEVIGTMGISKDITTLKDAELKLAYEQELLRALLEYGPDAIYFKDRECRFLRCSAALARRFKADPPDQVLGKSDADFYTPEHAEPALRDEQEIMRTGQPVIDKLEKETWPDGRVTWALTSKMPLRDVGGVIIGTFGVSKDVTAIKEAETKLEAVHRQLLETSRQAGMAEVATGVLHNVGNVLNSVNVSATLVAEQVRGSHSGHLARVCKLLRAHAADPGHFLTQDPRGRQIPSFLDQLAEQLATERHEELAELELLRKNIEHIKEIVAMQQNYAKVSGVVETVPVHELVEDALRMNSGALARHGVQLVRDYQSRPVVTVERHKVLQILVNLVRNAKYACDEAQRDDKQIIIRLTEEEQAVHIAILDNGVGIPAENLTRIFNHGFTTRAAGHGFGLHSGALVARELGGTLRVQSAGTNCGATFILSLPLTPVEAGA